MTGNLRCLLCALVWASGCATAKPPTDVTSKLKLHAAADVNGGRTVYVVVRKGGEAEREATEAKLALETLKGSVRAIESLRLAEPPQTVILVDKDLPTPERFPRRSGMPAKRPL